MKRLLEKYGAESVDTEVLPPSFVEEEEPTIPKPGKVPVFEEYDPESLKNIFYQFDPLASKKQSIKDLEERSKEVENEEQTQDTMLGPNSTGERNTVLAKQNLDKLIKKCEAYYDLCLKF